MLEDLTLDQLIGEDMEVYAKKINDNHIKIKIYDENNQLVYDENIHERAWESFVSLAKQVLWEDDAITNITSIKNKESL